MLASYILDGGPQAVDGCSVKTPAAIPDLTGNWAIVCFVSAAAVMMPFSVFSTSSLS